MPLNQRLDARAERGFSMFLDDHGDDRHRDVRRGRLRRRQRRPADVRRVQGPQGDLRRGRGRAGVLPQPPAAGPGLLDQVRQGAGSERDREEPDQPAVGRRRRRPALVAHDPGRDDAVHDRAAGHQGLDRRRLRHAPTRSRSSTSRTGTFKIRFTGRPVRRTPSCTAASSRRSGATASSTSSTSPSTRASDPSALVGLDGARHRAVQVRRQVPRGAHHRPDCPSANEISFPEQRQGQRPAAHQRRERATSAARRRSGAPRRSTARRSTR